MTVKAAEKNAARTPRASNNTARKRDAAPVKDNEIEVTVVKTNPLSFNPNQAAYDPTQKECPVHAASMKLLQTVIRSSRLLTKHRPILPFNIARGALEWPLVSYDINGNSWAKLSYHPTTPLAGAADVEGHPEYWSQADGVDEKFAAALLKAAGRSRELTAKLAEAMNIAIDETFEIFGIKPRSIILSKPEDETGKELEPSVQIIFETGEFTTDADGADVTQPGHIGVIFNLFLGK